MDKPDTEQLKQRLAEQYDKFTAKSHELFEASRDKSQEALNVAIDKTREQMTALGELSAEQAKLFQEYMKRDLAQTAEEMKRLGEQAKERLHPSRVGAGALSSLAALLQLGGNALWQMSKKADQALVYNAGEITSAGTLTCTQCMHQIHFNKTGNIPPCAKCQHTTFKKSY
jgi:isocitrate dehydrogenase